MNAQDHQTRLREYYQSELAFLRKSGVEFSRQYPGIAGRLELGPDITPDPFTERLIESFAWLTGRIRHAIDSRLPQISATLLGAMYPNFTSPVPSLSIVEFHPDPNRPELAEGFTVLKETPLECAAREEAAKGGEELTLKWRTAWPTTLYPIRVEQADFLPPSRFGFKRSLSVLRLRLVSEIIPLEECKLEKLRFFLYGDRFDTFALYEILMLHRLNVRLHNPDAPLKTEPFPLGADALRAVGLTSDEFVLPSSLYTMSAYQLVQEYFAFPERFLFFEIDVDLKKHLAALTKDAPLRKLDVLIPLAVEPHDLDVSASMFRLNAVPVVNLFQKISEPLDLDDTRSEYRLLADARRNKSTEIHTVQSVSMIDGDSGDTVPVEPFFAPGSTGPDHLDDTTKSFWIMERRPSSAGLQGTDVWLRFVDSKFQTNRVRSRTVFAKLLCTNRHRAAEAPAGTLLQSETETPCRSISLLTAPTVAQTPPMDGETLWMLISHLSLNYLSLEGEHGAAALREILRLYVPRDNAAALRQLQGLRDMKTTSIVRRMGRVPWRGFVQGIGIEMTLDETYFTGGSAYLFAEVMNRFFRLYAAINTPTELTWKSATGGEVKKQWEPNFGLRPRL